MQLDNITVADNIFVSHDEDLKLSHDRLPFHCGPLCEAVCTRGDAHPQCMLVSDTTPCPGCPNCSQATPWASIRSWNNSVHHAPKLPPVVPPPPAPNTVQVAACNHSDTKQHWSFDDSNGGHIKSFATDGLCLLATGASVGSCDAAPRWSMHLQTGASGKWLVVKNNRENSSSCQNLQVYNYSGPNLSQDACRIPPAEGARGSQNQEWAYTDTQFRSMATEQCCGSKSRPIPAAGLCMTLL